MLHLLRQQSIGSFTVKVREELDFHEKKGSDLYFDMRAQHCTCHYEHDDRTFWPPSTKAPSTIWYSGRYKTLPPDDTPSMCTRAVIASTSGGQLSALTRTVNRLPVSATTNTSFLGIPSEPSSLLGSREYSANGRASTRICALECPRYGIACFSAEKRVKFTRALRIRKFCFRRRRKWYRQRATGRRWGVVSFRKLLSAIASRPSSSKM